MLVAAVLTSAAVGLAPTAWAAPKSSPPTGGSADCGWTATKDYLPESMSFRLHLNLAGCSWWDGSARDLLVELVRDDGSGQPERRSSQVACSSPSCESVATVDHPENETDVEYRGTASWKWNDGRHRVVFAASCTTNSETVVCTDQKGR
jgi:hypothetical protein